MRSFSSLLIAGAVQATDFSVSSCNDANNNNAAAMTIQVTEDYMLSHHNDHNDGTFAFNGTHYTKTIQGSALTADFTDSDYIYLEHSLDTVQTDIAGTSNIRGRETTFKCKYPRAVNVGGNYTVTDDPDPSRYEETGFLQYDFTTTVANGRTTAVIAAQHGIPSLEANVQNCAVTFASLPDQTIYPVRFQETWGDSDVCIDNRIDTTFTYANGGATVDWRTFHFNDGAADTSQEQAIACDIHVSNTLTVSTPSNCDCHNRDGCRAMVNHPNEIEVSTNNLVAQGFTMPVYYKLKFEFFLDSGFANANGHIVQVTKSSDGTTNECGDAHPALALDYRTPSMLAMRDCVDSGTNNGVPNRPFVGFWQYNNTPHKPGAWQSFEFGQRDENGNVHYYVMVDGVEQVNVQNINPQSFTNMRLYASSPWFGPTWTLGSTFTGPVFTGRIRNLILTDETVF